MKKFDSLHPVVSFCYIMIVVVIGMWSSSPIISVLSLVGSLSFCGALIGGKSILKSMACTLPIMLIIALTNPIFVHKGESILFFLNGNPVTLEAILYGVNMSAMLVSIFYWFKCYNRIITSDKFIYLFGKILPKVSIIISMAIRFIPLYIRQYHIVSDAQKGLGIYSSKSYSDRVIGRLRVVMSIMSWSLENSISTADSMRARGYGLKGRSSYHLFKWTISDIVTLILVLGAGIASMVMLGLGYGNYNFYPSIEMFNVSSIAIIFYCVIGVVMGFGTIMEIKEDATWRLLKYKI